MVLRKRCPWGHWKVKATHPDRRVYELHTGGNEGPSQWQKDNNGLWVSCSFRTNILSLIKGVEIELARKFKMIVDWKALEKQKKTVNGQIKEENRNTLRREDKAISCYRCGKVSHIAAKLQTGRGPETGRMPTEKPQGAVTTDMAVDEAYRSFAGKGLYIFMSQRKRR